MSLKVYHLTGVEMVAMLETVGAVSGTNLNYQPEQCRGEPNSIHKPDGRVCTCTCTCAKFEFT